MDEIDPDDEEMLEEAMLLMRDHMVADHVARVTTQEEITTIIASHFNLLRQTSDSLGCFAMLLRRQPKMAEHIAKQLDEIAVMLLALVPAADEEEGA